MNNEQLQKRIEKLEAEIQSMRSSYSFPRDISNSIAERISDKEESIANMTRTGSATASLTRVIALTGDIQNITVLSYPDGFRVFRVGGKDYFIPYYNQT